MFVELYKAGGEWRYRCDQCGYETSSPLPPPSPRIHHRCEARVQEDCTTCGQKVFQPADPAAKSRHRLGPCVHLGEPTGQLVSCRTCAGETKLKLFACAVYGECTVGKYVEGYASCRMGSSRCPEFQERIA